MGTLRSRHGTFVNFDKIYVFCNKCCVRIDKCVFIVIKIKCMNSGRICDKVNFTTKLYILYNTWQTFIKTHIIFYQNTHKYYKFWHVWWDDPTAGPKNFPSFGIFLAFPYFCFPKILRSRYGTIQSHVSKIIICVFLDYIYVSNGNC